jgi:hypothetical protein
MTARDTKSCFCLDTRVSAAFGLEGCNPLFYYTETAKWGGSMKSDVMSRARLIRLTEIKSDFSPCQALT